MVTHTFLVTVGLDDDEDLNEVAAEILEQLTPNFGDEITVAPWAPHDYDLGGLE